MYNKSQIIRIRFGKLDFPDKHFFFLIIEGTKIDILLANVGIFALNSSTVKASYPERPGKQEFRLRNFTDKWKLYFQGKFFSKNVSPNFFFKKSQVN